VSQVVKWPSGDEMVEVVGRFHEVANMPMVIGCLERTLILIDAPVENEAMFVDRHDKHSTKRWPILGVFSTHFLCLCYFRMHQTEQIF
jgi:hypothetical protein